MSEGRKLTMIEIFRRFKLGEMAEIYAEEAMHELLYDLIGEFEDIRYVHGGNAKHRAQGRNDLRAILQMKVDEMCLRREIKS